MATSLSTQFISTPSCYNRPHLASPLRFSASPSLRKLTFDPFSSRRRAGLTGNSFLVRSSIDSAEATSELIANSLPQLVQRAEGFLYTLADAAVSVDTGATNSLQTTQVTSSDWLSGITNILESFLKTLQGGLQTLHAPYSFGFAIITLTIIVKAVTLPLTQKQVESSMAMQSLAPKVKAIQERYAGNQDRIQLETSRLYKEAGVNPLAGCLPTLATIPVFIGLYRALSNVANEGLLTEGFFWIPSLAGPTTIAARQSGSGISWLFPFVDGQPPLGWHDTTAYLVLPVLLVASQYISMQIMQTPQMDNPSQKNTQLLLKFLPLMIGYFSLSVPSGLSLYWFVNNLLSTGQQIYFKKIRSAGAADGGNIITAGQALRSSTVPAISRKDRRGEKFKQLKAEKAQRKAEQSVAVKASDESADSISTISSDSDADDSRGMSNIGQEAANLSSAKDSLEEMYSKSGAAASTAASTKRSKRSKRRRSA